MLQYANHWNLGDEFINWIHDANTFCSSLVDRIVPGFPLDSIDEKTAALGYKDELMVVGEQYHLWVIEGPDWIKDELPVAGTGLNTLIVDDLTPYRVRKVRIFKRCSYRYDTCFILIWPRHCGRVGQASGARGIH
ncbi:hypothetical protein GCM10020331_081490 [Ectobacillus funiculus]